MKKTRCLNFSKGKTKYTNVTPFIYNNNFIPFEDFYKNLGVEKTNNCEYRLVKGQRVFKAKKAIFSLKKIFSTTGNVSVDLAIERLRNENIDKTKTQMKQSFNQYSENERKIWLQNILNQFNHVSLSCFRSHFVISLMKLFSTKIEPILTYGSIIWGIESSNNDILIEGIDENDNINT